MHQPLKSLSFVTITLLLSLAFPVYLKGTSLKISETPAQAQTTQDQKAEADRLLQQGLQPQSASQLAAVPITDSQPASTHSTASGFSHPYYWAPFILIGNSL